MGVLVSGSTTYFAREDSGTAANNNLNPDGASAGVIAIQFSNDDPDIAGVDTLGNYDLNFNSGAVDPNTSVVYNGVSYPFTVNLVGTMFNTYNNGKKIDPIYFSEQVVIITFTDNLGVTHRVFFFPNEVQDATLMGDITNGAVSLNVSILTCLCEGTEVLTPNGGRAVETIRVGDFLLNDRGAAKQVIWVGSTTVSAGELEFLEELRPIRFPAGALGSAGPKADLYISPQHRVVVEGAAPSLFVGEERVLVAAKHLAAVGLAEETAPTQDVRYFHVLLEEHELLVTNGLVTESFQPARRTLEVMSDENQERLLAAIEALGAEAMLTRPDALPALSSREARVVLDGLSRMAGPTPDAQSDGTSARRMDA